MLTMTVPAQWLRIQEAAEYAGCTIFFMQELIRKREIPPIKCGKRFVIDLYDVDAYIERLQKAAKGDR